nr:retrovirus-related Pol polyprotein from transposon TNT 1-94 [Tanacetum cinerariifolium]
MYHSGKENVIDDALCRKNEVNILKSIDEGPFQMGTLRETLTEGTEGLPKDIYSLINHYTDAKDIWDNVKMLLKGSELTKEDRESQLYDDFKHFRQHKGETIHDYYVRFAKQINDMRNVKMTMSRMQLNSKFVNNMLPEWGAAGYGGAQNRVGYANPGQARQIKCYNCNGIGHLARNCTQPKRPQNSEYFKDKMLLMQAQENGVALDEEQLLFIAGGQDNAVDEDMDEQPVQDLALNVDNVFQADDCNAFDYDVDEAPTAQTLFMANLSSADPIYDEADPSYDSDVLSEGHDHDHYQDVVCEHHEYVKDNAVQVVQSDVSDVPNDAYMMILNDMHESPAQHVYVTTQTKRTKIDEQLRIVITDCNIKEEILKKALHSKKMQLASTINHNKSMVEKVTSLKKDFKQKENKCREEFLDMKALKEKDEDKLFKQNQSLQTVHMICKPKPYYDEQRKAAISYKIPLCLDRAKQVQPALYYGHEIIKTDHVPAIVHNSEDTLEIARITRKKMNEKMKTPLWTHHKSISDPHITPKRIFWRPSLHKHN